ncbi:MAG: bifunctional isocitrate dehydrogenase kinase/phosphatase [Pseudomonadota bacterium]
MDQQLAKTSAKLAYQILNGFDRSFRWHSRITVGAKLRFERALWEQTQSAVKERITIYEKSLSDSVTEIYEQVNPRAQGDEFWIQTKQGFQKLLEEHPQYELAETFYNSVIGRIFKHQKINNDMIFIQPSRCYISGLLRDNVINRFDETGTVRDMYESVFKTYRFSAPFEDFERDIFLLEEALRKRLTMQQLAAVHTIEVLKPVFYRGKAAYLIGRMCMPDETMPFVIALHMNEENKVIVDALVSERAHLSFLFSFARSYFMADTQHPCEIVAFLHELLPHKKQFELYISLGFYKHGKTEFYRNFIAHIEKSDDEFTLAPGIKGLVMAVFHLPSYGVVFKVIRDEFAESKKITRDDVKNKYRLVKMGDRVGRMADTHEYINFHFPLDRIDDELLEHLQSTCASSLEIKDGELIINHLYIERKMTPLNLYLNEETDPEKVRHAINELGRCIKQIAYSNIFPGDMLHKNFGITRTGRVIFYDYDEICYMDERNFRELPKSDDPYALDTLSVAPDDVFPEQFEHFIVGKKHLKELLKELHGDLLLPEYWRYLQEEAKKVRFQHFTPYPSNIRFHK